MAVEQLRERRLDHAPSRKFFASSRPERRQHRLGMELHAVDRQLAVADRHHLAVGRPVADTSSHSGIDVAASEW